MKGSIKINWRKKIRLIQGPGFDQGAFKGATWSKELSWVQIGAAKKRRGSSGAGENF